MTASGFCIRIASAIFVLACGVALFNALVDPYLLFDAPRRSGFNARKPSADVRERMIKAYEAPRHMAATLILGSSRSDIGLNPDDPSWPMTARPVYNLSVAGTDTRSAWRYLQHFLAERADAPVPRVIVVGLDFEYFLASPDAVSPEAVARAVDLRRNSETELRLAVLDDGRANPRRYLQSLKDRGAALLSLDALTDSVVTVAANLRQSGSDIGVSGRLSDDMFRRTVSVDGVANLFDQKDRQTIEQHAVPHQVLRGAVDRSVVDLSAVEDIVGLAHSRSIRVVLFVQPAHADRLELLDRMGYWNDYERWKVALVEGVAAWHARGVDVRLIDFGGYERFSQEVVPSKGDHTARLQWFWEPAHYTTALGSLMVDAMFGSDGGSYGVEIDPTNVKDHLARIRQDRKQYRADFPLESARLDALHCPAPGCTIERRVEQRGDVGLQADDQPARRNGS